MKRIFYFNVNYVCNSNCVFCYSHNTRHTGKSYRDLSLDNMVTYLEKQRLLASDRIIINGGEPLLHPDVVKIFFALKDFNCEVLVYTNGRLLENIPDNIVNNKFRFIIPWHGDEHTHDGITRVNGSYRETMCGIKHILNSMAFVEIKIIVNSSMLSKEGLESSLLALKQLPLDSIHAIHLTKVAETLMSKKNNYQTVDYADVALPTKTFFDYCVQHVQLIKIFDTCVSKIPLPHSSLPKLSKNYAVYFNDWQHNWQIMTKDRHPNCSKKCPHKSYCLSAVNNYTALEYNGKNWREYWE